MPIPKKWSTNYLSLNSFYNRHFDQIAIKFLHTERSSMIPIILCGGSGARLWPLKNQKVFYKFFNNQNLLEITLDRLKKFNPPLIVSVKEHKHNLEKTLKRHKNIKVIYEPLAKNTATSIALACFLLKEQKRGKNIMGIFPSDHYIDKKLKFQSLLSTGIKIAKKENKIVTFGIPPNYNSASYGYIKTNNKLKKTKALKATAFIEKPTALKATILINKGSLWNSGIFIAPVDILIHYYEKYLPNLWKEIACIKKQNKLSLYKKFKPISFDKGIMEHVKDYLCLPCDVGWMDLGSWEKLAEWNQKSSRKLNNKAKVIETNSHGNFIFSSEEKNFNLVGIKNQMVINSSEGLLITDKKNKNSISKELHTTKKWINKPWGAYRVLMKQKPFKYKELKVNPKSQLSYQSHKQRAEHWIVMEGSAEVVRGGKIKKLKPNQHIFIDQGVKHRLKNPTNSPLFVLEIQRGQCSEKDITRYKDDYGRSKYLGSL